MTLNSFMQSWFCSRCCEYHAAQEVYLHQSYKNISWLDDQIEKTCKKAELVVRETHTHPVQEYPAMTKDIWDKIMAPPPYPAAIDWGNRMVTAKDMNRYDNHPSPPPQLNSPWSTDGSQTYDRLLRDLSLQRATSRAMSSDHIGIITNISVS